jgi:hypothetical protein
LSYSSLPLRARLGSSLFPALLAAGLTLAPGCDRRRGSGDTGAPLDCGEGWLADGGACVPEACGTGTWGALELDEATIHVDIGAEEGGSGSQASPLRSVQEGIDRAASRGGGRVAVAAGTYPETLVFGPEHVGVSLAGRCRELVTLDASRGDEDTPAVDIGVGGVEDAEQADLTLSAVRVAGSRSTGIRILSGWVQLEDVLVEGCAHVGVWAYGDPDSPPVRLSIRDSELVGNSRLGLKVSDGGSIVTLSDTVIRDTLPDPDQIGGYGLQVQGGAELLAEDIEVIGNTGVGVLVFDPDSSVRLLRALVEGTLPREDGSVGYGVSVQGGATLTAEACEIAGNTALGITAAQSGTRATLLDTIVRDTQPPAVGEGGYGIGVQSGALLEAEGCEIFANAAIGVTAQGDGSEVILVDSSIRDTLPGGEDEGAHGLGAYDGARISAEGCEVVGNVGLGVLAADVGTTIELVDTSILDTRPRADGHFGYGVEVHGGARLSAQGGRIEGNTAVGVWATQPDTEVTLVDCSIRGTLPRDDGLFGFGVQVDGGARFSAEACELVDNRAAGLLAEDAGTEVTLVGGSIADTTPGYSDQASSAVGLAVQDGASATLSDLLLLGNEGPGLYCVSEGSSLSCTGCTITDNAFAGAVAVQDATLEIRSSVITGTRESVNLGGGVGIYAAAAWDRPPAQLLVSDTSIADHPVAGLWLQGDGRYQLDSLSVTGAQGIPHGTTTRCGDGIYAAGTPAWDGSAGLSIEGSTVSDNRGAGLFLDDGWAQLAGNAWWDNGPDLLVQGEACLSPRDDWAEVPDSTLCPTWDQPTCELGFAFDLSVAQIDGP